MSRLQHGGIDIDYDVVGAATAAPLLLIMGLGMQRIAWPQSLLEALIAGGFRCVSFDNRDAGLSTHYPGQPTPAWSQLLLGRLTGRPPPLAYTLADIADDAIALLDHLGIDQAHVAGMSMGGMIAQHLAARHPQRLRSLTLMATSSGRFGLPLPAIPVLRLMLQRPVERASVDSAVDYMARLFTAIGSPGYRLPRQQLEQRLRIGIERAASGRAISRQLAAIVADGSRTELLRRIRAPTLILHGRDDPMVRLAHGRDLARHIAGAELQEIPGWGHDLPDPLAPLFAEHIARVALRG